VADKTFQASVTLTRLPEGEKRLIRSVNRTEAAAPSAPGWACHAIAPGEWFLVKDEDGGTPTDLPPGYDPSTGLLVADAGAALVGFHLTGPSARSLVSKGTFADLGRAGPVAERWLTCRFGHFRTHLHLPAGGDVRLYVDRSQAEPFAALLGEFGAEFGLQIR